MTETRAGWAIGLTILLALPPITAQAADDETGQQPIKIGMVSSLFRDMPEPLVTAMMRPFGALMQTQTGVAGELVQGGEACHLGRLLADGKVQLAVMHGVEFAWAKQQYPQLTPMMIAVNQQRNLHVCVVTRKESKINQLADLHGKKIGFPKHSRQHCQLYFERRCVGGDMATQKVFSGIEYPANVEDAIDDVVDGILPGAVIDSVGLDCYQRRKPGRFGLLKVIQTSEAFPAAVIAYVPGTLDEDTIDQFQRGLINAKQTAMGRQFMMLWKLTSFEPVPANYEASLASIAKAYPPVAQAAAPATAKKPTSWFPAILSSFPAK
jgi:ABC-type phosphate/phosphonate transport system substrate-binding protein